MYSLKITGINGDHVTADVSMPVPNQVPAAVLVNFKVTFNSVEFDRSQMQPMVNIMCGSAEQAQRMAYSVSTTQQRIDNVSRALHRTMSPPTQSPPQPGPIIADDSPAVASVLGTNGGLRRALASLIMMRDPTIRQDSANFIVERSDANEFVLRVVGGRADSHRFRLDRRVDLSFEFLFEREGYFTVPYRIESLSTDSGRINTTVAVDCSRDTHMEVFMSEHSSGPHPLCNR